MLLMNDSSELYFSIDLTNCHWIGQGYTMVWALLKMEGTVAISTVDLKEYSQYSPHTHFLNHFVT